MEGVSHQMGTSSFNYLHTNMKQTTCFILICLSAFFCCALTSCQNEDDATPISVWYDDTEMPAELNSGDQLHVKASLYTGNGATIKSYKVVFDDYRNPVVLKTEELNGAAQYLIDFYAEVPYIAQEQAKCRITTQVEGMQGFKSIISRELLVHGALKDYSGFKLYASGSGRNNGFLLSDLSITYKKEETDSLDVYFSHEGGKECWRTSSDVIDFVRANNYNFAKATINNLAQTYESSTREKVVEGIKAEDIIIVGFNKKAWGVFSCLAYDDGAKLYTFSYKQMPLSEPENEVKGKPENEVNEKPQEQ